MLSYLALKGDEFSKLTALNFRKQMKKLCNDNKDWSSRASDKKWFNYDNLFRVAHYYNQTKEK